MEGGTARNSARAGATPGASGGRSEAKVFQAPASLITVPARSSRPSCIRTPTARWRAVEQDFADLGAEDNLPAGRFDDGRDAGGNAGCSAHGKTGAFEIVRGDDGVHAETALRRWQAVIAPLRRQHAGQFAVGGNLREDVGRGAPRPTQEGRPHQRPGQARDGTRQGLFRKVHRGFAGTGQHRPQVAVNGGGFTGKIGLQAVAKSFQSGHKFVLTLADADAVVNLGHGTPLQASAGEMVEDRGAEAKRDPAPGRCSARPRPTRSRGDERRG